MYSATAAAVVQSRLHESCSVYYFASFYVRQKVSCSFAPRSQHADHGNAGGVYDELVLTGGAVVDLAVPDAALTDDVPCLSRRAARDDRLVTSTGHVGTSRYDRVDASNHCNRHTP